MTDTATIKTIDFASMDFETLGETHGEMLATTADLGMPWPAVDATAMTEDELRRECTELHAAIEKFRAGIDEKETLASGGAGDVSQSGDAHKPKRSATKKKKTGKASAASESNKTPVAEGTSATAGEKTVAKKAAKKAVAKKSAKKSAKKAVAKKAVAKKGATPKRAAGAGGAARADRSYTISAKENPYRPDTERYGQFEFLRRGGGSLNKAKELGAEAWILRIAVRDGHAKDTTK